MVAAAAAAAAVAAAVAVAAVAAAAVAAAAVAAVADGPTARILRQTAAPHGDWTRPVWMACGFSMTAQCTGQARREGEGAQTERAASLCTRAFMFTCTALGARRMHIMSFREQQLASRYGLSCVAIVRIIRLQRSGRSGCGDRLASAVCAYALPTSDLSRVVA